MPVFGIAGEPELWEGELYREEPEGYLVSWYGITRYLPRDLAYVPGTEWGDTATWEHWRQHWNEPQLTDQGAWDWEFMPPPKKVELRPAGGVNVRPTQYSLLTIKIAGVTVIKGTEEAGINMKQENVDVVTGGTGTITVTVAARPPRR